MKLYSKISVFLNFLTVGILLSLGMITEYMLNLSRNFSKQQYPAIESTLKKAYKKHIKPQQLAV